jgi:hypothetical protein
MVSRIVTLLASDGPHPFDRRLEASKQETDMRDLTTQELGFVYGAGGCGKPSKPSCGGKGSKSKGTKSRKCGSKSRSRGCGTKSRGHGSRCG